MKRTLSFLTAGAVALVFAASLAAADTSAATTPAHPATMAKSQTSPTPATTGVKSAKPAGASHAAENLVDLNSASREDLIKLPGVGEAIADKIIAGRPWTSKSQLLAKNIVNKAAYAKLRGMVVARQAAK